MKEGEGEGGMKERSVRGCDVCAVYVHAGLSRQYTTIGT